MEYYTSPPFRQLRHWWSWHNYYLCLKLIVDNGQLNTFGFNPLVELCHCELFISSIGSLLIRLRHLLLFTSTIRKYDGHDEKKQCLTACYSSVTLSCPVGSRRKCTTLPPRRHILSLLSSMYSYNCLVYNAFRFVIMTFFIL